MQAPTSSPATVRQAARSRTTRLALLAITFIATLALRIWGVTAYSLVLRDQYRDWEIVQGTFGSLPLLGPATHVGGYTIGPGFYWILWLIRVVCGPWFEYLPHAGGIGQAALQSAVDVLLLAAIWKRTGSVWPALATVTLVATSAFDLSFAATIWNPVVGSLLAKCAIALVLLDWHRREAWRAAVTMGVAWLGVHAYTGAIYVAAAVGLAIVAEPLLRRAWMEARGVKRVLVVSDPPHMLRLSYAWSRVFAGSGLSFSLVSSRPPWWSAWRWWANEYSRHFVGNEVLKLAYYVWHY